MKIYRVTWMDQYDDESVDAWVSRHVRTLKEAKKLAREVTPRVVPYAPRRNVERGPREDPKTWKFMHDTIEIDRFEVDVTSEAIIDVLNGGVQNTSQVGIYIVARCGACAQCESILNETFWETKDIYEGPPSCEHPKMLWKRAETVR